MVGRLRELLRGLRNTPLHPQWFAFRHEQRLLRECCAELSGTVLDVGCAEGKPRAVVPPGATYIGLDYYSTATNWYGTLPDVFGDAHDLPFVDSSFDHALLLDVLEHLREPDRCLGELYRVIKPGGTLTIQVPFFYPLHDEPLDFHRWTRHGLRRAATANGYSVATEAANGHPLESAALSANIALSRSIINWIQDRNPLMLLAILAPFAILATNFVAWLLAALSRDDDLMPISYRAVWVKE